MEFKTIKELYDAVKSGKIDESKLSVVLDNDCTSFCLDSGEEEYIEVSESCGYNDIEPLYKILFPKADVMWC